MDFVFVNAINYGTLTPIVMLIYDIMCKFIVHFRDRVMELSDFLEIPENIRIKQAIGLFHVHGHIKQCFARFAPTFIRGSGMLAGEIIETLWSSLNHTASSARTMSWYHRQEYLDAHMGDSNWKKLTGMGMSNQSAFLPCGVHQFLSANALFKRWKLAKSQAKECESYFDELCKSVGPENTKSWTELEEQMQLQRDDNIKVMDQLDVKERKGCEIYCSTVFRGKELTSS